jgi:hypothetical protein
MNYHENSSFLFMRKVNTYFSSNILHLKLRERRLLLRIGNQTVFLRGTTIFAAGGRSAFSTRCSVSVVVSLLVYVFFYGKEDSVHKGM